MGYKNIRGKKKSRYGGTRLWAAEAGGPGVQGHPLLCSEFLVSLPGKSKRVRGERRDGEEKEGKRNKKEYLVFQEVAPVFPKPEPARHLP